MEEAHRKVKTIYWYALFVLAIVTLIAWIAVFRLHPDFQLHVNFYDVGQGDSIFIQTMAGNQVLIDGGPDATVLSKLGDDLPFYDRTLDLVILTHPHADHVSGLVDVMKRYKVKKVIYNGVDYDTGVYRRFRQALHDQNIPVVFARAGQRVRLDDATVLDILHPLTDLTGSKVRDVNESSIVSRLSFGKTNFLLTGDASVTNERQMVASGYALDAEVLKVGHQGSRTSTNPEFLQAVLPDYAVISVGTDNRYGHPHAEVVERLESVDLELLRTDHDGDIRMTSDGETVEVD